MHYLLFYEVVDNYAERRTPFRAAHLEYAKAAVGRGELVLGGAFANPIDGTALLFKGSSPTVGVEQKSVRLAKGFRDVHDLTHTFTSKTPVFPAFKPIQIKPKFSIAKDGFFANEITFDEHTGTHMDAPAHFVQGSATADKLPADKFIAPLAVISIESRASKDADAVVTVDDVLAWEKQHGKLPAGA